MCGIVAGVSYRDILPFLLKGICALEYRGYDSCGIATINNSELVRVRSLSRVTNLKEKLEKENITGEIGIAHTRWATHGAPSISNTHPHFSHETLAIVHNGIIENYAEIKSYLLEKGYVFESQTDTETVVHLIHSFYQGNLFEAVKKALPLLKGAYAIAVMSKDDPDTLVAAKSAAPLVLGLGDGENFLASDPMALTKITNKFLYLEEGDVAEIKRSGYQIFSMKLKKDVITERKISELSIDGHDTALGNFSHYMEKEIFEQPEAVDRTVKYLFRENPFLKEENRSVLAKTKRILILACGTSYHAGLVGKYWIEKISGIPCDVEIASEYRYRQTLSSPSTLVVAISQSGETADTLAALRKAKENDCLSTLCITNVPTSSLSRETNFHIVTKAGPEIGVASTKAFTTQLVSLLFLAFSLKDPALESGISTEFKENLKLLPQCLESVLRLSSAIQKWAVDLSTYKHSIFLGRGSLYPVAMEGALKLKEISYIHAESYPAGELKHGPLALIDVNMPTVVVAPSNFLKEKIKSNLEEVRARNGRLFVLSDDPSIAPEGEGVSLIQMPKVPDNFEPIAYTLPLQLLAYFTALIKGTDIDKPRNLAKSVTVE